MRVGIIGGGIVGLATAYRLFARIPNAKVTVLEKEREVGLHQSGHNSGVLHAGAYYKPGSAKARLAVAGIRQMVAFAGEHGIPYEICGKLVVATRPSQLVRLRDLENRSRENGLSGVRWVSAAEIPDFEPYCRGLAALHVPEEGIIDYGAVCRALQRSIRTHGGEVRTEFDVSRIQMRGHEWILGNSRDEIAVDFMVNCGGLYSDRVARRAGHNPSVRIVPFRGEYFRLKTSSEFLVRNLIYPVPDPVFPFLGVHFTRQIGGGIEAGPNAVLALSREGYRKRDVRAHDLIDAMTYPGLWRFLSKHKGMCWAEFKRSMSRSRFADSLRELVPALRNENLERGGAGVRAQAMSANGNLIQDFSFVTGRRALHVLNAPSPAATASLAIGGEIADLIAGEFSKKELVPAASSP